MDGLQLAIGQNVLAAFLLALARTAGFVLISPPFNTRSISGQARVALAIGLALPLTSWLQPTAPPLQSNELWLRALMQILMGVTLGFFVLVAVALLQMIGDLIDIVGGFNLSIGLDPLMLVQSSVMGRLHQLLAGTLLFVTDGHVMVIHGLARSVATMPSPALDPSAVTRAVATDVAHLAGAALEIAAPIIAVLFIADIALGLLTRAAPALNAFALAYPLKILLTLLLVGLVLPQLPGVLHTIVSDAVFTILRLSRGG